MKILKAALAVAAGSLLFAELSAGKQENENLRRYSEGVSLMNLLNGLNLSVEQQQRILDLNKELRSVRDAYFESQKMKDMEVEKERSMGALYNYLLNNPEKEDKAIQSSAAKSDNQTREYRDKSNQAIAPELARIAKEVEGILSSQQLEVVNGFSPCVVPPKDMRDPVRAGQAKSNDAEVKALIQARALKAAKKDVDAYIQKVADRTVEASEHHGKLEDDEKAAVRARVSSGIKKALTLSDTDFEIQKELLAKNLEPANKMDELRTEMNERNPHANPFDVMRRSKVVQFLVNPDIVIPVLERRIQLTPPGGLKDAAAGAGSVQPQTSAPKASGSWR